MIDEYEVREMKYNEQVSRPIVMGRNGMVSTGHPLASQTAFHVLRQGGNAVDAAVSAAWVLAVVKPEACGLGGDVFALYYDAASERLESINGSGRSPATASLDAYCGTIPRTGPRSATVPGAVRGWADTLSRHGTMSLAETMKQAIAYAEEGFPVSVRLSAIMRAKAAELRECSAATAAYLRAGEAYAPGEVLRLPDLAASLREIAAEGADAFYIGALGDRILHANGAEGGLFNREDFARQETLAAPPLSVTYRGLDVCVQRPVSMGFLLLQQMMIAEGFDLAEMEWDSAKRVHLLAEAVKLSFGDGKTYLCDPEFRNVPTERLLSADHISERRRLIDANHSAVEYASESLPYHGGHTTYLAVVDAERNAVSWSQTLFGFFGSCWVAPGTGILLNNRLSGFSTDSSHVNRLEGGKRTAHTLLAPMLLRNGRPILVLGTPGDYGQTQTNLQMLTNFVDHGMDVQSMIDAPRWRSTGGCGLAIEARFTPATLDGLGRRGHDVDVRPEWTSLMGGAQAIRINHSNGCLEGAADPRREGYAIGW